MPLIFCPGFLIPCKINRLGIILSKNIKLKSFLINANNALLLSTISNDRSISTFAAFQIQVRSFSGRGFGSPRVSSSSSSHSDASSGRGISLFSDWERK